MYDSSEIPPGLRPPAGCLNYSTVELKDSATLQYELNTLRKGAEATNRVIGIALSYQADYTAFVSAIALSTLTDSLLVDVTNKKGVAEGTRLLKHFLCDNALTIVAVDMARVALRVFLHLKVPIRGVDAMDHFSHQNPNLTRIGEVAGLRFGSRVSNRVDELWDGPQTTEFGAVLRAWITNCVCDEEGTIAFAARVDTQSIPAQVVSVLGTIQLQRDRLSAAKPSTSKNDFFQVVKEQDHLVITNARYKTKIRCQSRQVVVMTDIYGRELVGRAVQLQGRTTRVTAQGPGFSANIEHIEVRGREDPTNAESSAEDFFLAILQRRIDPLHSDFIRRIWFHDELPSPETQHRSLLLGFDALRFGTSWLPPMLNPSQKAVALAMLDVTKPLVIAHGPPGTGKTRTIVAAVQSWTAYPGRRTAWLVAQSNVGVKNIAEALVRSGSDNFRLLVSKDFHFEWHEHIYERVEQKLIRTDELPSNYHEARGLFDGVQVILCTLSTISNPKLEECQLFDAVPLEMLVIDEASQIYAPDYMHVLHRFRKTLAKVCWFGDPEQLPPFQKEQINGLTSIFDFKHLQKSAYFLDTQYRMPVNIGQFLSMEVYDCKLKSIHSITDRSCLTFIDARKGREERKGTSWMNTAEVQVIEHLVRGYYRHKDFVVITPYDTQREAIERTLETAGLPWEGRVFNLDSFQGNEAEYVLISVVRTDSPGFLTSRNRMNVMLSRCKKGMIIVSNRMFFSDFNPGAQATLLGKLVRYWGAHEDPWVNWLEVVNRIAWLPGMPVIKSPERHVPALRSLWQATGQPSDLKSTLPKSMPASTSPAKGTTKVKARRKAINQVPPTSSVTELRDLPKPVKPMVPRKEPEASWTTVGRSQRIGAVKTSHNTRPTRSNPYSHLSSE